MKIIPLMAGGRIETPYLTISEAAQYCRLDRRSFVALADRDSVPYRAKGRSRIYDCHNLDTWMARRSSP